jgi:hypothetical protein
MAWYSIKENKTKTKIKRHWEPLGTQDLHNERVYPPAFLLLLLKFLLTDYPDEVQYLCSL